MGSLWIPIVGAILTFGLVWSHIQMQLRLHRVGEDDRVEIKIVALYGLFKYTFPTLTIPNSEEKNANERPSNPTPTKRRRAKAKQVIGSLRSNMKQARRLLKTLKSILSHVKCTHFEWRTRFGSDDASATAIAIGSMWALKSMIVGVICRLIQMKTSPRLNIIPLYNQNAFSTEGLCILKLRFGYAMVAGVLLLVRIVMAKGGIRTWMSTRFKAS